MGREKYNIINNLPALFRSSLLRVMWRTKTNRKDVKMNIAKLNKAGVLAALYNNARVQGLGVFQAKSGDMTIKEAQKILNSGQTDFDYLYGRVMKVDLSNDELDTWLYNRDNGDGAAEKAIELAI